MLSRASKFRLRRALRLKKRQVGEVGASAEQHLERNLFRRIERLMLVRRFLLGWMLLLVILTGAVVAQTRWLSGYYQESVPIAGGTYREGILGQFTNANPIYAASLADASVSRLVFAGLLTYDGRNQLAPDLAESWQTNDLGDVYTVELKPDLTWHDGEPLTAADVVFTFNVIKNPDARSPLNPAWRDVKISAENDLTVVFELPNPLASFPHSLTTGIIPQHILEDVPRADLRSSEFNAVDAIGAGPFRMSAVETSGSGDGAQERIALASFEDYHGGKPALGSYVIRTYRTEQRMTDAFASQDINAMAGLNVVPEQFSGNPNIRVHNMLLTAEVMSFFKNSQEVFKDKHVRQALVRAADPLAIMRGLPYPTIQADSPLLKGQLGYDRDKIQLGHNVSAAREVLDENDWRPGDDGIRRKGGTELQFNLHALDTPEYSRVAEQLADQWSRVGVDVQIVLEDEGTLQNTLAYHEYDALLHGIEIGPDPDVFVYWHSSQADPRSSSRLNFSEYKSNQADAALEDARTRLDPALRAAKLEPFLDTWRSDAPALALYQPRFLYITRGEVHGLTTSQINSGAWRLSGVQDWMIRETRETFDYE